MKLFLFVALVCLAVSSLASKPPKKPQGPRHPPPRRHSPNLNAAEEKVGRGPNGSEGLNYGKPPACVDPATITTVPYGKPDFFVPLRVWYYSGSTQYGINLYYRIFNGRPATTQSQINEVCPAVGFTTLTDYQFNSGSGVQFAQSCSGEYNVGVGVGVCHTIKDNTTYDKGVDVFALERQEYWLISTDSATYVMFYVCNDYTSGDIQLLTTRPYIDPELMTTYLSLLEEYGISPSQAEFPTCNAPPFTGYPTPFEGYPLSGVASNGGWGQGPSGWANTVSSNGWSAPSAPSNGWSAPPQPSNGWSANNGWSSGNGPSNGWSSGNGPSSGWGAAPVPNCGWSAKLGKYVVPKKEEAKKAEAVAQEAVAEVVAEVAQ